METVKEDKANHGYGLKNVTTILDKKGGNIIFHINQQLFGIMVSAILIILFKDYLDRVVTFFPKGYSSGFVEIKFDLNMKVKKIQERIYPNMGNVVTFELYTENQYKGYDKFVEEEYLLLKDRLYNSPL